MSLAWSPQHLEPVVCLASAALLYFAYYYHVAAPVARRLMRSRTPGEPRPGDMVEVLSSRLWGMAVLGAVPLAVVTAVLGKRPEDYGAAAPASPLAYLAAAVLCLLLFPVLLAYGKASPATGNREKWIPRPVPGEAALNAGTWTVYLAAYEFFMRGFLLFPLARAMGPWPAVAAMTLAYTAVHLHRPRGETAGCLVMGPLLGALTLWSGSLLPALLVHVFIANTTDLLAMGRQ
ncbi:MAG: CPBP family intramembrane glutamic endopeptidase, partial [Spirochaetota bacterium]